MSIVLPAGRNISCDLHLEHLNNDVKSSTCNLGPNRTDVATTRASCSLKGVSEVISKVDTSLDIHLHSSEHTRRSDDDDLNKLVRLLCEEQVFRSTPGRYHRHFSDFKINPFSGLTVESLFTWINKQKTKMGELQELFLSSEEVSDLEPDSTEIDNLD